MCPLSLQMSASDADIEALCQVLTGNLRESLDYTPTTPTKSKPTSSMSLNVLIGHIAYRAIILWLCIVWLCIFEWVFLFL